MPKKPVIKTDLSFDELLEKAIKTPPLKKGKGGMKNVFVLTVMPEKPKRKPAKKAKKAAPKKKAAKKSKAKK